MPQPPIVNVVVDFWDGTTKTMNGVEIHIPTPGIIRYVTPGAGSYEEIPFGSIKEQTVTPQ